MSATTVATSHRAVRRADRRPAPRPPATGPGAGPGAGPASALGRIWAALAAPLLLSVILQNVANFGFHAVVGRVLPAGDYGALGAVLSIMVLLSVPLTALQAAASAVVSAAGWDDAAARRSLLRALVGSLVVGAVVLALAPAAQAYFRLPSLLDAAILAPFVAVSALLAVARGLLLGDRQVTAVAWTYVWGTAARFALGVALVLALGVTGALIGTLAGELVALAVGLAVVARRHGSVGLAVPLGMSSVGRAAFAVTGLFLFSTVDLLLARHHLPDAETGAYVAAATIAKTVLALPAAAMGVYYPRLVAAWGIKHQPRMLRTAMVVVVGLAAVGAVAVAAVPRLLLTVLYGAGSFPGAADLVRLLAIVAGLTSVVSVLTYAALARRSWAVLVPWAGALLEVALIEARHATATQIALSSLAALIPTLLVMAAWEGGAWWRAARRQAAGLLPRGRHRRRAA